MSISNRSSLDSTKKMYAVAEVYKIIEERYQISKKFLWLPGVVSRMNAAGVLGEGRRALIVLLKLLNVNNRMQAA